MAKHDPTRDAALRHLAGFVPQAGRSYGDNRNYDRTLGQDAVRSSVSGLSPYLRHRLISEGDVIRAVLDQHSLPEAMPFLQQVFWRGYFKGWLEQHPSVWHAYRADLAEAPRQAGGDYSTATSGRSGIACFDHWFQQLRDTGYLHNHARLWFASIWIFTLRLPWQLGADFFLHHLKDADPASNTLSWRWVAGLHTKGKHYLATADNIARFTDGRFHPVGQLNETAAALTEDTVHPLVPCAAPEKVPEKVPAKAMPKRALWLITEEDCLPPPCGVKAEAILGLVSPKASAFAQQAVKNSTEPAGQFYLGHRWSDAITRAAKDAGVRDVVCAYLPVGPAADGFAATRQKLAKAGLRLHYHMRDYDRQVWPHATKGYFRLKKQIPTVIEALM